MTQPTELDAAALGPSDAELIAAVRGGDAQAYGALFERHASSARNLARQHSRNDADADDLVSEAFAKVLAVLQAGGGPDVAFRSYLFTTLRRVAYDRTKAGSKVQLSDDLSAYDPGVPFVDPAIEGLERTLVAEAYATLPERWRAVLWHMEVEELSPVEIAPILGLTANGVSALAYRAREGLRQAYLQQHLVMPHSEGCAAVNDKLGSYARGGLSKRETAQVEEHLTGCVECRALVAELADVNHGMRVVIAPLILGVLGVGLLKSGALLGGSAAAASAVGAAARSGQAAGGAAAGTGAAAGVVIAGAEAGAGAAAGGGAGLTGAVAAAAARLSLNPAAAVGIAAATIGIVGLSAVAIALLGGGGGETPTSGTADGGLPGVVVPVPTTSQSPSSSAPPTSSPSEPAPTDTGQAAPSALASSPAVPSAPPPSGTSLPPPTSPSATPTTSPTTSPSPTSSPTPTPTATATPTPTPTPTPIGPILTLNLEPLGDLVAGRSGVIGFTAGNSGDTSASGVTADITLPPGVTLAGTSVLTAGGRFGPGLIQVAPFAVTDDWSCLATDTGATCTGPELSENSDATAYLEVVAAAGSEGTTPVSITVSAPDTDSVTVTGTSGVAPDGYAASFADRGHLAVTEVGAPLLSCPRDAKGCAEAQARTASGSALNNDSWTMVGVDDDAHKATQTSSSSLLDLPATATVTWAGLYWSANVPQGVDAGRLGEISLAAPGQGYVDVLADRVDTGQPTGQGPAYQSFADVTAAVRAGGAGTWWAADAAARTGAGRFAGWSLVVVYSDKTLPEGRVSVVDGFRSVSPGQPATLALPGTAGMDARIGMVAWEGDAGIDGDVLTVDGEPLAPAVGDQSANNVADAFAAGSRYANTLGVDAKPLSGATFTGTSAQVRVNTRQDIFLLGVLTVSSVR